MLLFQIITYLFISFQSSLLIYYQTIFSLSNKKPGSHMLPGFLRDQGLGSD